MEEPPARLSLLHGAAMLHARHRTPKRGTTTLPAHLQRTGASISASAARSRSQPPLPPGAPGRAGPPGMLSTSAPAAAEKSIRSKRSSKTRCSSARSAPLRLGAPAVFRCRLPGRYSTKRFSRAPNRGLASAPALPAAAVAGKSWGASAGHQVLQPYST